MTKSEVINNIKDKRILSIDFGLKRIGLAICDPMHIVVSPYDFLINDENLFTNLTQIINKEFVGYIILGYPFRLDNQESEVTKAIIEFKNKLEELTNFEIYLQDESFTSVEAKNIQLKIGTKKKKRKEKSGKDKIAAALILQDFLREFENY